MGGISALLALGILYLIWSGSVTSLIRFKRWFILPGIVLILLSLFFIKRSYSGTKSPHRARLMILFGPGISGGLAGLAAIAYAFNGSDFWWLPVLLAILSLVAFQVAFILAILVAREHTTMQDGTNPGE
jgi:hypothetical protein